MDLSELDRLEQVGKIKLSDAIRIGSKRGPQCKYLLRDGDAYCALGAAALGRGWEPIRGSNFGAIHLLNDIYNTPLFAEIGARNDAGHTREAIASWLAEQGL